MAYSDDAVKAKLSALNESQDSIVTVAQWIMFHRRHAPQTAHLWHARLTASPPAKRLNLIYLANEVVQQSRARGKPDFLIAFEPLIADATGLAYEKASQEVQGKIRRVVEVWRQRGIFGEKILEGVEGRLSEVDKARGSGGANGGGSGKGRLGGALFGGSGGVPQELDGVAKAQTALNKAEAGVRPAVNTANTEYAKMSDPNTPLPTPPVHAARLSSLVRNLATAHGAVEASIKARRELLAGLEKLAETHRSKLAEDETTATDLSIRREGIETKKKEVEDGIMRGLSAPSSPDMPTPTSTLHAMGSSDFASTSSNGASALEAPEAESFTPPPPDVESFTPPPNDLANIPDNTTQPGQSFATTTLSEPFQDPLSSFNEPPVAFSPTPVESTPNYTTMSSAAAQANEFLNSINLGTGGLVRPASSELNPDTEGGVTSDPRLKRRKVSHGKKADVDDDGFGAMGGMGANEMVGDGVDEDEIGALLER